ncbi:HNH endonuclease [Bacteroides sp. OttesenSCG-928-D19]|nr:HNH endonuclease [Bacteroides sp. OttesenSCG-928-D19]
MTTIYKPKKKQKTKSLYDKERRKIYNSERWRKLSNLKFIDNPLCENCQDKGVAKPSEDIHHIISFMTTDDSMQRIQLAYDYNNLMSLCKECHQEIHNKKIGESLKCNILIEITPFLFVL